MTTTLNIDYRVKPFNPALHAQLLAMGYSHQRRLADWQDHGDAESGPSLVGTEAYDEYEDADSRVFYSEAGDSGFETRDLELEAYIEANLADGGGA